LTVWKFNVGLYVATLAVTSVLESVFDPPGDDGVAWPVSVVGNVFLIAFYTLPTLGVYGLIVWALGLRLPHAVARLAAVALAPVAFFFIVFPEDIGLTERIVAYTVPSLLFGALVRLPRRRGGLGQPPLPPGSPTSNWTSSP
jgi:hypothetical protein